MVSLLSKISRFPLITGAAAIIALAGCASQVPLDKAAADAEIAARIAAAKASLDKVKPSVYFDFDRFDVKSQYQPNINAFADYLKVDTGARLVIEGNADERGTTEYNLALGQKRAEAVRKALSAVGITANRVEAISNGEEKPRAKGHEEADWTENRRADLMVRK